MPDDNLVGSVRNHAHRVLGGFCAAPHATGAVGDSEHEGLRRADHDGTILPLPLRWEHHASCVEMLSGVGGHAPRVHVSRSSSAL
jgi:hypothetical protein